MVEFVKKHIPTVGTAPLAGILPFLLLSLIIVVFYLLYHSFWQYIFMIFFIHIDCRQLRARGQTIFNQVSKTYFSLSLPSLPLSFLSFYFFLFHLFLLSFYSLFSPSLWIGTSRYMPQFTSLLHYRIVDVSTVKELCRRWYPVQLSQAPPKKGNHRALDVILPSLSFFLLLILFYLFLSSLF